MKSIHIVKEETKLKHVYRSFCDKIVGNLEEEYCYVMNISNFATCEKCIMLAKEKQKEKTMKFEEVLPAFREGRKIRHVSWRPDEFLVKGSDSLIYNEKGSTVIYNHITVNLFRDGWEIIEELFSFKDAFEHYMKGGKIIRRGGGIIPYKKEVGNIAWFAEDDILSNEWRLL